MLLVGAPVTFMAGALTKNLSKWKHMINLLIHIIPAIFFGFLFMFIFFDLTLFDSVIETLPFTALPIIAASIFFMFDEIIFHRISFKTHKAKLVFLVPIIASLLIYTPSITQIFKNDSIEAQINQKEPPSLTFRIDGKETTVRAHSCWVSEDQICVQNPEPTLIPVSIGVDGLTATPFPEPEQLLSLEFENTIGEPEVFLHYYSGNVYTLREMPIDPKEFTLPANTPMQKMKVFIRWDNNEQMLFTLGSAGSE